MLIDTHVHFDDYPEGDDLQSIIRRASAAGIGRMIAVGGSAEANDRALRLARLYPDRIFPAVGYNRDQSGHAPPPAGLDTLLASPGVAAVGEIGLDYHYDPQSAEGQRSLFRDMLAAARRRLLPAIVHSREADADILTLLREHRQDWTGAMISFSGILTFKKSDALRSVAARIPDDRLLIETDAPYLAPEPYRGQPNEPAFVRRVAEVLADVRKCPLEMIAALTTRNAENGKKAPAKVT